MTDNTDFITRRMATELTAQEEAAGHDIKKLRALDRAHKRWEARYPEQYTTWWHGIMEKFAHKHVLKLDYGIEPFIRLVKP